MTDNKPRTHYAYVERREGREVSRLIEIGTARIEKDGAGGHDVYLDRLPIGGFSGHIHLLPIGVKPSDPQSQAKRPGQVSADEEA